MNRSFYDEDSKEYPFRILNMVYNDTFEEDSDSDTPDDEPDRETEKDYEMPRGVYYMDKMLLCRLIQMGLVMVDTENDNQDRFSQQTSSSAKTRFNIGKSQIKSKTAFYIGDDVLFSKTQLLNDAFNFIKEEIFTNKIRDRSILMTSKQVTLKTNSGKSGLNLEAEEKIEGVDVYTLTYKSALLKIYAVGNETDDSKSKKTPLSQKLKSITSQKIQLVKQKNFGFNKNELVESYLIAKNRDIKTEEPYTKSLQFVIGNQKIFDVRLPMKDFLKYSSNSDHQVYFFPQIADDEPENTISKTFWDPTTKKQISLFDVDGYWMLCFGKKKLLYIVKVNIAPNQQTFSGTFDLSNDIINEKPTISKLLPMSSPPPSDSPPKLPPNVKSTEKFFGINQPKSSNGINHKNKVCVDESKKPEIIDYDRIAKIHNYVDRLLDTKTSQFEILANIFTKSLFESFQVSFFSQNYTLKSMIDMVKIGPVSSDKFLMMLGVFDVDSVRIIPEVSDGSLQAVNHVVYDHYLENIMSLAPEAVRETEVIKSNIQITSKLTEVYFLKFVKNFSFQNRALYNLEFVNTESMYNIGDRIDKSEPISTDHIKSNMTPTQIYAREIGIYQISKKINMSDALTRSDNFTRHYIYETANMLVSLFIEFSQEMFNSAVNLLKTFGNDRQHEKSFFLETVVKELFSICELLYTHNNQTPEDSGMRGTSIDAMIANLNKEINILKKDLQNNNPELNTEQMFRNSIVRATKCDSLISTCSFMSFLSINLMNQQNEFESEITLLSDFINGDEDVDIKDTEILVNDNIMTITSQNLSQFVERSILDGWDLDNPIKKMAMESIEKFNVYYMSKKNSRKINNKNQAIQKPLFMETDDLLNIHQSEDYENEKNMEMLDIQNKVNEVLMRIKLIASIRCMVLICIRSTLLYSNIIRDKDNTYVTMKETRSFTTEILNNLDCYNRLLFERMYDLPKYTEYADMRQSGVKKDELMIIHDRVKVDLANMFLS